MDDEQAYLFDLDGYIVIRGALDPNTVQRLMASNRKRAGDGRSAGEIYKGELANGLTTGKAGRPRMANDQDALHWDKSYRDIMAHPQVCAVVEQLCGPNFRLDHVNVHARPGKFDGGQLHGGSNPGGGNGFFFHNAGSFKNGLVSVTYELEDTHCNGGGFCCVPGSHKSNLGLPAKYRDLSKQIVPAVRPIPAAPGDCIIFTEVRSLPYLRSLAAIVI
eukprot:COSAG05_NODE_414_length_10051_cov_120.012158_3_plen_218_part_00